MLATKGWLAISESVAVRLREYLKALEKNPDIKNTQSVLPCDFSAVSAAATLFIKSLLSGIDSASRKNNFDDTLDIDTLPFDEAVAYLKKRDVLTKTDYDALADKMKFRAFTASRVADGDLLKRINSALIQNETAGGTLKDFLKLTNDELLDKVGRGPNAGWYWETVYRTNMQTAYNTGRAIELNEVPPLAFEFIAIDDTRTSDICKPYATSRVILPPDDPFWETHWPPLHFNCRSTVRGIYDEDELPDNFTRPTETGHTAKGFGRYPLANDDWWRELESQAKRAAEYGVQGEIIQAAQKFALDRNAAVGKTGGKDSINTGGILDKSIEEQDLFADSYYEEIRNRKSQSDIKRIAKNSGLTPEQVTAIRNHVFIEEHNFADGVRARFDTDVDIALAWQRLDNGKQTELDILLLKHELEELTLMKKYGYIYEKAHLLASKKYPWSFKLKGDMTDDSIQAFIDELLKFYL